MKWSEDRSETKMETAAETVRNLGRRPGRVLVAAGPESVALPS